jgi:outer membrane biosynthesis protein TonB
MLQVVKMSSAMQPMALDLVLPWQPDEEQERKFKALLKKILLLLLLLFVVVPFLPIFEKELEEPESELVITKVLLKPIEPPPVIDVPQKVVPPPIVEERVKPKEVLKPETNTANIKTPSKKKSGSADKTAVKSDKVEEKISVQSSQGLNELSSQLSALRGSLDLSKMQNKNLSDNTTGTAARSPRELLGTDQVTRKSGGVNIDGSLLKNSSTSLADHTTTAVDGVVENGSGPSGNQAYLSSRQGQRDLESIRRTLERTKSNVFSLYQRARVERPDLAGKFVFKIVIEPDGSISDLQLISSELGVKELESEILTRIRQVNFGPKDVSPTAVEYKFMFLPS